MWPWFPLVAANPVGIPSDSGIAAADDDDDNDDDNEVVVLVKATLAISSFWLC